MDTSGTMAEWLIQLECNLRVLGSLETSPLHIAAKFGNTAAVHVLLHHHAPLDVEDPLGRRPLDVAGTSAVAAILRHAEQHTSPAPDWVAVEVESEPIVGGASGRHTRQASVASTGDVFSYSLIAFRELDLGKKLGSGSFGTVYKATWKGRVVAAKVLKQPSMDSSLSLSNEIRIFSRLEHPNIIEFIGACLLDETLCLCTEFATHGSLYEFLYSSDCTYDVATAHRFGREIANGMQYLAQMQILHRDLKSPNILLTESKLPGVARAAPTPLDNITCKICDFGLSKMGALVTSLGVSGTVRWMSPEVMQDEPTTAKTDVYSFGMVLWEVFVRKLPFGSTNLGAIVYNVVRNHARPPIPARVPRDVARVIEQCWAGSPDARPAFDAVIPMLEACALDVDLAQVAREEAEEESESEAEWDGEE